MGGTNNLYSAGVEGSTILFSDELDSGVVIRTNHNTSAIHNPIEVRYFGIEDIENIHIELESPSKIIAILKDQGFGDKWLGILEESLNNPKFFKYSSTTMPTGFGNRMDPDNEDYVGVAANQTNTLLSDHGVV